MAEHTAEDGDFKLRTISGAQEYAELVRSFRGGQDVSNFEITATALSMTRIVDVRANVVAEALAILLPEQREFWLRVEATVNERFVNGALHIFESEARDGEA